MEICVLAVPYNDSIVIRAWNKSNTFISGEESSHCSLMGSETVHYFAFIPNHKSSIVSSWDRIILQKSKW